MVYQQIVGIPMGTNCTPLIADLFLYCYERDFMSNLQKSKRFNLVDKFNDTSRYLADIFTIDNPAFAEHITDIYPRELQLNKANTSDKNIVLGFKAAESVSFRNYCMWIFLFHKKLHMAKLSMRVKLKPLDKPFYEVWLLAFVRNTTLSVAFYSLYNSVTEEIRTTMSI